METLPPTTFGAEYLEPVPVRMFGGCPLTDKIRVLDMSTGETIDGIDYFEPNL